ncbi:copper amine oxidase N-terminal domain-containing protein [Xylanibacillus composti]|uniref:Copper amine oxidase-like N-terminal domain-containing protein n=1 Tax=Xylanibacillus composti TaxID=1572762 RepID=A0A8J4H054_9BACL|nr:copper amine oxidase N-terminal domain-containing protein [Xylanibacillus composti]MDT9723517.1 copper amine oxidase N-terminal domain-containing protein [Xylanibacillus composti]GIQ68447.1 hypothetical protein XYCOK13_12710 [Xylanibacillus composti]
MKKQLRWKTVLTVLLAVMVVWLAGCEAVGGTNLNQVLVDNLNRESYEADGVITLKLIPNESAAASPEDELLRLFGHEITLRIDDMKLKNRTDSYISGALLYAHGEIGFDMYNEADGFAVKLDGYDQPIVMNNAMFAEDAGVSMLDFQQLQEQLIAIQGEIITIVGQYAIERFPNPEIITVEQAVTTVNQEELQATHIHMEVPGDAIFGLLQQFLNNIAADEEGLRELIGALYDAIVPVLKEHMGQELEADPTTAALIDNREFVVELLFTSIQQGLTSVSGDIQSGLEEAASALHPDTRLILDYYLDEKQQIRKTEMKLFVKPLDAEDAQITAFELTSSEQYWNINGDVVLPAINVHEGVGLYDMDNRYEFLKHVDRSSDLYELLQAAGETKQEVYMFVEDSYYATEAYVEDGTAYMPVRYVSEQLYADVSWDHESKQITIEDHPTGQEIILAAGSSTVRINGEDVTWEKQPQVKEGMVFVPAKEMAEALGVHWYYDEGFEMLVLTREF